ncbi:hypothetical protein PFICI_08911 [Pestalotiopsis fici W106-1]|uniref:Enoyl reductase (ER) domain-containing protein n=1 Tax=Pestalotiopsis fici (strain W106-1 / CGMCC3.15140) TaxID=1229662 RepID=W3WYV7_PESFW|nr:uncharacterized protein PFICI_08911 [Pestalotiopsis fici W106-1]ETS79058.1 hypothetical protein PFICI_08911 [Pestalotiopsis fici W106-1]
MASNTAAWLPEKQARPFQVKPAPMGVPLEGQILIKNHVIGINPIDVKNQLWAVHNLTYPVVMGGDVAGEVVSVGPSVTSFSKGNRVIGTASWLAHGRNDMGGFQEYTVLEAVLSCKIPDTLSYETAGVVPLCFSTAAAGLFQQDYLNLQLPTEPARASNGQTVLIWGGTSSVGCNAIQLAVAAGYEVITTASAKNFGLVEKLGASRALDYQSPSVVADLVRVFEGKTLAGVLDCVGGPRAGTPILELLAQINGGNKFVATVTPGFPETPEGTLSKHIYSLSIRGNNVGPAVWKDFLPHALASGSFVPAPEPFVVGKGLESIQAGLDHLSKGVSAQKVIVTL